MSAKSGGNIRPANNADSSAVWGMLEPVFRAGESYAVDRAITREEALEFWCGGTHTAYLAEAGGDTLGSYYICPNQQGGGAHVCNCGFVTAPWAQGQGVARGMLEDSLTRAKADGYRAMQFNFVVDTNARAVMTWQRYGFDIVGRLPGAFLHPKAGYVDALVMYRVL